MTDEHPRSTQSRRSEGRRENGETPGGMTIQDKKIARGRQFYENVGTFRDVFKIVLTVIVLIAIVIVFVL